MNKLKNISCNARGHWISFWICLAVAVFLMIGAALTPPAFVIDASIFKGVAWLFGFAALSQIPLIIESGRGAKLTHGNTTLVVGKQDENDESTLTVVEEQNDDET